MATFAELYAGEVPDLRLLVVRGGVRELPDDFPDVGVYRMTRQDFITIAAVILAHSSRQQTMAGLIATLDDPDGDSIGGRWFRLSEPVQRWLLLAEVERVEIDGIII